MSRADIRSLYMVAVFPDGEVDAVHGETFLVHASSAEDAASYTTVREALGHDVSDDAKTIFVCHLHSGETRRFEVERTGYTLRRRETLP